MIQNRWWILVIDHRISTALIFFLLLMLNGKKRRARFGLHAGISLALLCSASWAVRMLDEVVFVSRVGTAFGYSLHLLVMCLLYWVCYSMCYEATTTELAFADMFALTVYKLAWNFFKVLAAAGTLLVKTPPWGSYSVMGSLVSYAIYAPVCFLASKVCQHYMKALPPEAPRRALEMTVGIVMICQMILEFCGRVFTADTNSLFLYHLCALMYTTINYVCLMVIMQLGHYRRDNEDMHNFIKNRMQYYRMSREGITSLQIKCHDLKHQIAAIRSRIDKENFDEHLTRLEDSIIEYGTVVECGNETINTVLTEKNILCATHGVKFSYMLDGSLFDFMSEMEIYSLFGNALDNALESCSKVESPDRRMISLKALARGEMVILHVENFFSEAPTMVDGMPVTTKKGSGHGFGLRSIQQIAEKYNGIASVQVDDPIFKLTVMLRQEDTDCRKKTG